MNRYHWQTLLLGALLLLGEAAGQAQTGGFTVNVGDILVACYDGFSVVKIEPETGNQVDFGTFIQPTDLVLHTNGSLYVAELEGAIQRLDLASGTVTPVLAPGSGPGSVFGITLGPQGELYVTSGADDAVYRVNPATGQATVLSSQTNLIGVVGIDLLDPAHLVVSCSSVAASALVSVALSDGAQQVIVSGGLVDQPWGVAAHGTNLYTTAYDSRLVLRVSGGQATDIAHPAGFPYGLAVDLDGNVVVGSKGTSDQVLVYGADGTPLHTFGGGLIALAAGIDVSRIRVPSTPTQTVFLQSAEVANGSYADDPAASVDLEGRTVTVARGGGDRFYRLRSETSTRIAEIRVVNNQVVLRWE